MARKRAITDNPGQLAGVAAIAAAIGAVTAMMLASKSGAETREEIRLRAKNMRNKMRRAETVIPTVTHEDIALSLDASMSQADKAKYLTAKKYPTRTTRKSAEIIDVAEHIRRHGEP